MVAPISPNRKGIYRDLYREIDSENNKNSQPNSQPQQRKGIYKNLYKEIALQGITAFKNIDTQEQMESVQGHSLQFMQRMVDATYSKITCFFSSAQSELKMIILALMFVKKPINSYIENINPEPSFQKRHKRAQ